MSKLLDESPTRPAPVLQGAVKMAAPRHQTIPILSMIEGDAVNIKQYCDRAMQAVQTDDMSTLAKFAAGIRARAEDAIKLANDLERLTK